MKHLYAMDTDNIPGIRISNNGALIKYKRKRNPKKPDDAICKDGNTTIYGDYPSFIWCINAIVRRRVFDNSLEWQKKTILPDFPITIRPY